MSRELMTRWFNKLPTSEQDLPLLISDGIAYTPRTALNEVNRGSAIGTKLQQLVESGRFGTTTYEETSVAKTRLRQILSGKAEKPMFATMSGKVFTPSQLLQEIEANSQIGQQWINAEMATMSRIVAVR